MCQKIIKVKLKYIIVALLSLAAIESWAQCSSNIEVTEFLAARENGRVDFTVIGDSQNPFENNKLEEPGNGCNNLNPILSTSANLSIPNGSQIRSAYLYWSGTNQPITSVQLNGSPISADRCWQFDYDQDGVILPFFGSTADVTTFVRNQGNGNYTLTGLDNRSWYNQYQCSSGASSLLYGGWALLVIYENSSFSNNSIFIYDGFRNFDNAQFQVNIQTNVFDDYLGSHVGLIAWEGDDFIQDPTNVDLFQLNGVDIINDAGDSPQNIFNGTDSFENPPDFTFFNGDLDNFNIDDQVQNLLNTPAANFNFRLSSGQDFIVLNTLVMRLPNEAPDALVEIPDNIIVSCEQRTFNMEYTYFNSDEASQALAAGTPITFYLNEIGGQVVGNATTEIELQPGEQANGIVEITLANDYLGEFEIVAYIDDPNLTAEDFGTVLELFEENNTDDGVGYIDQHYRNLQLEEDLCEGDVLNLDGTIYDEPGVYPFDLSTVRGGCDSTGVLTVIGRPNFNTTNPLEEVCEGDSFTKPDGEVLTLDPRETPYEFTDLLFSEFGCDSIVNSSFLVKPHARNTVDVEICEGEGFLIGEDELVFDTGVYESIQSSAAANGCDSIITYNVDVLDVLYPNAFAPNGNGVNDGFRAIIPEICPNFITEYHLQIFNRWGQLVFETFDVEEAWDGNFNGDLGQKSFFLWYAEYSTSFDQTVQKEGGVTLIR